MPGTLHTTEYYAARRQITEKTIEVARYILEIYLQAHTFFLHLCRITSHLLTASRISPLLKAQCIEHATYERRNILYPSPLRLTLMPQRAMPQGCHLPPPARHAEHAYRKGLLENHQPQTPCHRQRGMPLLPLQSEGALRQRLHEHAEQPTLQQAGNRHRQPDSRLRPTHLLPRPQRRTPAAPRRATIRTERLQTSGCRHGYRI